MNRIFWLASYPKSGNTWMRALLTNYTRDCDEPASINELDGAWTASLRETFDEVTGLDSAGLNERQIAYYRPLVQEKIAAESAGPVFFKVHDAYTNGSQTPPLFSRGATAGAVYLVRNPLDVAVSYAHHRCETLDRTIAMMRDDNAMLVGSDKPGDQLPQKLRSWSTHVSSWVNAANIRVHVVRYEDLVKQTAGVFADTVAFLGLELDLRRVDRAVEFSSFQRLRAQEFAVGFAEKQPIALSFFRSGRAGSWHEHLTAGQVQELVANHREGMQQFGYLGPSDEILC